MKSVLRMSVCAAAMAFAVPALAQSTDTSGSTAKPMHHHKMMHHKGMKSSARYHNATESSTAKLNEQSLQNAKSGTDASAAPGGSTPASGMAPPASGAMAPPAAGAMAPPASGSMAPPASGAMAPPAAGAMTPPPPASH